MKAVRRWLWSSDAAELGLGFCVSSMNCGGIFHMVLPLFEFE